MVHYCVHTTFFAVHCLSSIGFKTGRDAAVAPVGKEADTKNNHHQFDMNLSKEDQ